LFKVTKCAIHKFTDYIYLLFTQRCERFPMIICLLLLGFLGWECLKTVTTVWLLVVQN
jgi:hypothetical protein